MTTYNTGGRASLEQQKDGRGGRQDAWRGRRCFFFETDGRCLYMERWGDCKFDHREEKRRRDQQKAEERKEKRSIGDSNGEGERKRRRGE